MPNRNKTGAERIDSFFRNFSGCENYSQYVMVAKHRLKDRQMRCSRCQFAYINIHDLFRPSHVLPCLQLDGTSVSCTAAVCHFSILCRCATKQLYMRLFVSCFVCCLVCHWEWLVLSTCCALWSLTCGDEANCFRVGRFGIKILLHSRLKWSLGALPMKIILNLALKCAKKSFSAVSAS